MFELLLHILGFPALVVQKKRDLIDFYSKESWSDERASCPNGYHTHVQFYRRVGTKTVVVNSDNWLLCTSEYQEKIRESFVKDGYTLVLSEYLKEKYAGEVSLSPAQGELSIAETRGALSLSEMKRESTQTTSLAQKIKTLFGLI